MSAQLDYSFPYGGDIPCFHNEEQARDLAVKYNGHADRGYDGYWIVTKLTGQPVSRADVANAEG